VSLRQYASVRVRRLLQSPEAYDGWRVNQRHPRVGDVGTIIDILQAPGLPDNYVVEAGGSDGATLWLGDFSAEELEEADS
jgi:hypothetical protein